MKKLKLKKIKKLPLKTKEKNILEKREKLDFYLDKAKENLKKEKPVKENIWIDIKKRLPDDTNDLILVYYPKRGSGYDLLPSFLVLQHYIYESCCLGVPSSATKWMKFERV